MLRRVAAEASAATRIIGQIARSRGGADDLDADQLRPTPDYRCIRRRAEPGAQPQHRDQPVRIVVRLRIQRSGYFNRPGHRPAAGRQVSDRGEGAAAAHYAPDWDPPIGWAAAVAAVERLSGDLPAAIFRSCSASASCTKKGISIATRI